MPNSNGFRVVGECGVELEPMALYELREMLRSEALRVAL